MKMNLIGLLLMMIFVLFFNSFRKDNDNEPLKVDQVTGLRILTDRDFSQMVSEGLLLTAPETNSVREVRESISIAEIESNIVNYYDTKFNVIIAMTYDAAQPVYYAEMANTGVSFFLIDYIYTEFSANMVCIAYEVDQVSFLAGSLTELCADKKNPLQARAGFIVGTFIPATDTTGYEFKSLPVGCTQLLARTEASPDHFESYNGPGPFIH